MATVFGLILCSVLLATYVSLSSETTPTTSCDRDEKLDLKAIGVEPNFVIKNPLHVLSHEEFSIDEDTSQAWDKCSVSNFAEGVKFWVVFKEAPVKIDEVALLSRRNFGKGAKVVVGSLGSDGKPENECNCLTRDGGDYPSIAGRTPTYFNCSANGAAIDTKQCNGTEVMAEFVLVERASYGSLQICELSVRYNGRRERLKPDEVITFFDMKELAPNSNYPFAIDGDSSLNNCARSIEITGGEIWFKLDLHHTYDVTEVWLQAPNQQHYKVYVSRLYDFEDKLECNRSFHIFNCFTSQFRPVQHVLVTYKRAYKEFTLYQMAVCEIEVYYRPSLPVPNFHRFSDLPCGFPPYLSTVSIDSKWENAAYTCDNKTFTASCKPNGKWDRIHRKCYTTSNTKNPVGKCPTLSHPKHGSVTLLAKSELGETVAAEAEYSCAYCHKLNGDKRRTCYKTDLKWKGEEPECKVVKCGSPPAIRGATVQVKSNECGSVAVYKCKEGKHTYKSEEEVFKICRGNGEWVNVDQRHSLNCLGK